MKLFPTAATCEYIGFRGGACFLEEQAEGAGGNAGASRVWKGNTAHPASERTRYKGEVAYRGRNDLRFLFPVSRRFYLF